MRNLICGDIHGDKFNLCDIFNLAKSHNCQRIINVGDFGFFPGIDCCKSFLDLCSNLIFQTGIQFSFVDGNHEDHQFLNQFSGEVRNVWKGIEWNWRGKVFDGICSFGGAYSIDKEYREIGFDWFPEETISETQVQSISGKSCDVLLSHDCPFGIDFGFLKNDFGTYINRQQLLKVVLEMKPKLIIHGHYHNFYFMRKDFGYGMVEVVGLNRNKSELNEQCGILEDGQFEFL